MDATPGSFSSHTPMVDRAKEDGVPINVHFQQLVPVARIATSSRLLMRSSLPLHSALELRGWVWVCYTKFVLATLERSEV